MGLIFRMQHAAGERLEPTGYNLFSSWDEKRYVLNPCFDI